VTLLLIHSHPEESYHANWIAKEADSSLTLYLSVSFDDQKFPNVSSVVEHFTDMIVWAASTCIQRSLTMLLCSCPVVDMWMLWCHLW